MDLRGGLVSRTISICISLSCFFFVCLFVLAQTRLPILDTIFCLLQCFNTSRKLHLLVFLNHNFHSYYMRGLTLDAENYMQSSLFCGFELWLIFLQAFIQNEALCCCFCEIPNNPSRITSVSSDVWEIVLWFWCPIFWWNVVFSFL